MKGCVFGYVESSGQIMLATCSGRIAVRRATACIIKHEKIHFIYVRSTNKDLDRHSAVQAACDLYVRSTNKDLDRHSAVQAACDPSIARVTGCAYPREGCRSVTLLLMPGSTGLRRSALLLGRGNCITRIEGERGTKTDMCGIQYA